MTENPDATDYLEDIREAAEKAQQFVSGMTYEAFIADDKTMYAVVRALEVIGEATKRLDETVRLRYPDVPWRAMAGMRDKLIHDYIGVNWQVVWKTVTEDAPLLERMMQQILDVENDE